MIKAEVRDPRARTFAFTPQKTLYGSKYISRGDTAFIFASENEGGRGLITRGVVNIKWLTCIKVAVTLQPRLSKGTVCSLPSGRREGTCTASSTA
jgi:hypothetical protein